jgi:hypothetical protein
MEFGQWVGLPFWSEKFHVPSARGGTKLHAEQACWLLLGNGSNTDNMHGALLWLPFTQVRKCPEPILKRWA